MSREVMVGRTGPGRQARAAAGQARLRAGGLLVAPPPMTAFW